MQLLPPTAQLYGVVAVRDGGKVRKGFPCPVTAAEEHRHTAQTLWLWLQHIPGKRGHTTTETLNGTVRITRNHKRCTITCKFGKQMKNRTWSILNIVHQNPIPPRTRNYPRLSKRGSLDIRLPS